MTDTLYRTEPDGRYAIADSITLTELLSITKSIVSEQYSDREPFTSPTIVSNYVYAALAHKEREEFLCLFLDCRNRLVHEEVLFVGTIDGASVHPREIIKTALSHNAAALIIAHNHPSGVSAPSQADEQITRKINKACTLLNIRLLDHIVVGADGTTSFASRGLL
ncbi:MAG: DNA repair protein RadC [Pseudomonadota bacterium]